MDELEGFIGLSGTICAAHIVDSSLASRIAPHITEHECSYCDRDSGVDEPAIAVSMDVVGRIVFDAATWLFADGHDGNPDFLDDIFSRFDTDLVVRSVVHEAIDDDVIDRAASDITDAIATPTVWMSSGLQDEFLFSWDSFAETVKHRSRFVYIGAEERKGREHEPPARVSQFLEGLDTYVRDDMLTEFKPGGKLYRARMVENSFAFISQSQRDPAKYLGPAPAGKASAGRLNPEGVGLFYGATTPELAVKETALHSLYDEAVVGAFNVERQLNILDFTKRPSLPSVFDEGRRKQYVYASFADDFVERLTRSVRLTGEERVEYVATQIISEYFRWAPKRRLDGIAWGSHLLDDGEEGMNVLVWASADDVRSDPPPTGDPVDSELWIRTFGPPTPVLTLSRRNVARYRSRRSVAVGYVGLPGDDDPNPLFLSDASSDW